jgi:hypothetical protein
MMPFTLVLTPSAGRRSILVFLPHYRSLEMMYDKLKVRESAVPSLLEALQSLMRFPFVPLSL